MNNWGQIILPLLARRSPELRRVITSHSSLKMENFVLPDNGGAEEDLPEGADDSPQLKGVGCTKLGVNPVTE
jgi:hypothetical protein